MEKRVRSVVLGLVTLSLSACGSAGVLQPATHSTPAASSAASHSPQPNTGQAGPALVVLVDPSSSVWQFSTGPTVLHFMREDGTEASRQTLRPGVRVVAAAGSRVFLLERGGVLKAIHADGTVEVLGSVGGDLDPHYFVASPDGTRWLWSTCCPLTSTVHLGGLGMPDRIVEQSSDQTHWLRPFRWSSAAAIIAHSAMGIGGYILYDGPFGRVDQLDPNTLAVAPINLKSDCTFSDLAADSSIACIHVGYLGPTNPPDVSLKLVHTDGTVLTVPVVSGDRVAGDAYFSPEGKLVTFDSSPSVGSLGTAASQEQFHLQLVDTATGAARSFGPHNVKPAFWLSDGSLVVYRPVFATSFSETPTTYVVRPDGTYTTISTAWMTVGFVSS